MNDIKKDIKTAAVLLNKMLEDMPGMAKTIVSHPANGIVLDIDGWLSINATKIKRSSLCGNIYVDGYSVMVESIHSSNNRMEPDSTDEDIVLESNSLYDCVLKAVLLIVENHLRLKTASPY